MQKTILKKSENLFLSLKKRDFTSENSYLHCLTFLVLMYNKFIQENRGKINEKNYNTNSDI